VLTTSGSAARHLLALLVLEALFGVDQLRPYVLGLAGNANFVMPAQLFKGPGSGVLAEYWAAKAKSA
jgi:hypothetical protein